MGQMLGQQPTSSGGLGGSGPGGGGLDIIQYAAVGCW